MFSDSLIAIQPYASAAPSAGIQTGAAKKQLENHAIEVSAASACGLRFANNPFKLEDEPFQISSHKLLLNLPSADKMRLSPIK